MGSFEASLQAVRHNGRRSFANRRMADLAVQVKSDPSEPPQFILRPVKRIGHFDLSFTEQLKLDRFPMLPAHDRDLVLCIPTNAQRGEEAVEVGRAVRRGSAEAQTRLTG